MRILVPFLLLFALIFVHNRDASVNEITYTPESGDINMGEFDHSYAKYNSLLNKYVKNARVDYKGLIQSREQLDKFILSLGDRERTDFANWTKNQKLAFWINAYNAFTLKAIIDHYPIKRSLTLLGITAPSNSIRQIPGVWDTLPFTAVGETVTLGQIEHEILRKEFNEPRIHAAINCASIGCPDLSNEAYTPQDINNQLARASAAFINNPEKGLYIDRARPSVKFSNIMKWFGEDFIENYTESTIAGRNRKENAILNFAVEYLHSDEDKDFLKNNKYSIGYLKYDWNLNEQITSDTPSS